MINDPTDILTISFEVPRESLENPFGVFDSFAESYNRPERVESEDKSDPTYDPETKTVANPVSKQDFMTSKVIDYIDDIWSAYSKKLTNEQAMLAMRSQLEETRKTTRDNIKITVQ